MSPTSVAPAVSHLLPVQGPRSFVEISSALTTGIEALNDAETITPSTVWLANRARGGPPLTIESAKARISSGFSPAGPCPCGIRTRTHSVDGPPATSYDFRSESIG